MHEEICSHLDRLGQKINSERCFGDMQAKNWTSETTNYLNTDAEEIMPLTNELMFEMADAKSPLSLIKYLQTVSTLRGSNQEN